MEKRKYKFDDVKEYLTSEDSSVFEMGWIMFKQHIWVQGLSDDELYDILKFRLSSNYCFWSIYRHLKYDKFNKFKTAVNKEYQKRNKIIKYELIE
jgi:hypothetical protein